MIAGQRAALSWLPITPVNVLVVGGRKEPSRPAVADHFYRLAVILHLRCAQSRDRRSGQFHQTGALHAHESLHRRFVRCR